MPPMDRSFAAMWDWAVEKGWNCLAAPKLRSHSIPAVCLRGGFAFQRLSVPFSVGCNRIRMAGMMYPSQI